MIDGLLYLFSWLPPAFEVLAGGAVILFFLLTILRLWAFVKDLIPFL